MKSSIFILISVLLAGATTAQNLPPVISNVEVSMGAGNTMTLHFDLSDDENDPVQISFQAGPKGGVVFDYETGNATGDIGAAITPGTGKTIQWDFSAYASMQSNFRLKLVADDLQPVDIQAIVDQVDSATLYGNLAFLEGVRHRTAGAAHLQETKDFIREQFSGFGLAPYSQTFPYQGYQAENIIGWRPGISEAASTYIIDGHFDSVEDAPGADDNGSAVAGMLEAARLLSPYSFKKSIRFIGFDLEEEGLVGSGRYAQNGGILSGEDIKGVVNFEMIGYYTEAPNSQTLPQGFELLFPDVNAQLIADQFRGNFITNVGGGNSAPLADSFAFFAAQYVPDLKVITLQPPFPVADLARSDHASFWLINKPAIMLTDGAEFRNPNYHTPNDKIGTLNFTFMSNVVKAAIATLAELAEIQHADTWWGDTDFSTNTISKEEDCQVKLTPNPVSKVLQLHLPDCLPVQLTVELIDQNGKIVKTENVQAGRASDFTLNTGELAKGIYYLRLTGGGKAWVEQLVVE